MEKLNLYCGNTKCRECILNDSKLGFKTTCVGDRFCPDFLKSDLEDLKKAVEIIEKTVNDPVNRPSHYTDGKIEVIEFIEDKKLGFCLGNAIKYIARAGKKNPDKTIEDINKAIWYLNRYIKELEEGLV
jgi:hypothetical protein